MKTTDLIAGKKVISISANHIAGTIVNYTTLSGKNEKDQKNNLVRIDKFGGGVGFVTADLLIDWREL